MGDMQNKKMREQVKFWVKVKKARGKYLWGELTREAKKLALAVILAEYLIAGAWYMLETRGVLDYFKPKVVIIEINRAEAKQDEPVKDIKPDRTTELANIIWHLESTKGVHNYSKCEAQGKVNGIGYGIPGDGSYKCFDDHDQGRQGSERKSSQRSQGIQSTADDSTSGRSRCTANCGRI